ncbi:MAG TPA: ATP-binding protein [Puia sp.]|nr:ATP-binding protein [Puia sp.]
MKTFNDISIRNKLVLMQVLTSVLVLGIFSTIFINSRIKTFKARKADDLRTIAGIIAQNSVAPLQFQDNDAARKMLTDLGTVTPDIRYGAILDRQRRVFAAAGRPGADTAAFRFYRSKQGTFFSGNNLIVVRSITGNPDTVGDVYLQIHLDELPRMREQMMTLAVALAIVALFAAFALSYGLEPYISARLRTLVRAMQRAGQTGEYRITLEDRGKDEIGILIREFNDMLTKIDENQRRKDEFIGVASHELKTPLTNVKGYLEILQSIEDRQPNRQMVERAFVNAKKLEKLIADLLDVTKIQTGQLELNFSWFDLDELIRETINSTRMLTKDRAITFNAACGRQIRADRQRIEQVLLNLLSNAVKYSADGLPIAVNAVVSGADVIVEVADQGSGIPAGEEDAIFGRFYRARGISPHISGFGLGLYICRDIIIRHQGRIWVKNRADGASFFFRLPLEAKGSGTHKEIKKSDQ